MAALPLDKAGPYVAGAYVVFLGLILVYVAIMAGRLSRIERELEEINRLDEDEPPVAVAAPRSQEGARV